jgi:hypothetical protein
MNRDIERNSSFIPNHIMEKGITNYMNTTQAMQRAQRHLQKMIGVSTPPFTDNSFLEESIIFTPEVLRELIGLLKEIKRDLAKLRKEQ